MRNPKTIGYDTASERQSIPPVKNFQKTRILSCFFCLAFFAEIVYTYSG
jgi:hypothetical protein